MVFFKINLFSFGVIVDLHIVSRKKRYGEIPCTLGPGYTLKMTARKILEQDHKQAINRDTV